MYMGSSMIESARIASTRNKLDAIEAALMAYRTAYNRIPCPADATLATGNANYGVEAANMGSCTGGTPAANLSDSTHLVVEGAVPVKSLHVPEEFMYDGWGRKFEYAAAMSATAVQGFASIGVSEMCGITVRDAAASARTGRSLPVSTTGSSRGPVFHFKPR